MEWIKEHPKIAMSAIFLAGIGYFAKDHLLYFVKKKFFLYQNDLPKPTIVTDSIPTVNHPLIDPNKKDTFWPQNTALHKACIDNNIDKVRYLLNHPDIDPNVQNRDYDTSLHLACDNLNLEIIKLLLNHRKTDPNIHNRYNRTPLSITYYSANLNNKLEIIKLFIENPKTDLNKEAHHDHSTLLKYACKEGWTDIVKMALEREDIDVNRGNHRKTYLHLAHKHNRKEIFELLRNHPKIDPADLFTIAVEKGYEDIVEELLNKYALDALKTEESKSVNNPAKEALHAAAYTGNTKIFKLILNQKNIDINALYHDSTALHSAISSERIAIVKLLLQQKEININLQDWYGTPFYFAITKNKPEIALLLYNHAPNTVNIQNKQGKSPLMQAASQQQTGLINFLINVCNANISLKDNDGKTFFHHLFMANEEFDLNQLTFFHQYDDEQKKLFLNAQLESFAQITFKDKAHKEVKHLSYSLIDYCKGYDVNFNQRNTKGKIPLDIAYEQYKSIAPYIHAASKQFLIKEKIYHAFLNTTEKISDHELWYHLSRNRIDKDVYQHIMKYYYALTIDLCIVRGGTDVHNYYEKTKDEKIEFRKNCLAERYKHLGIFGTDADKLIHSLTL